MTTSSSISSETYLFSNNSNLTIIDFYNIVFLEKKTDIDDETKKRLIETREFVDYLLDNNHTVYGLSTGFGDLRNCSVSPKDAQILSKNIIHSHDAGIGKSLPFEVILGAMVIRANSLAQGYSAFKLESLQTLIEMINERIIPLIPCSGSLGASGDLAFLARLGRAMSGEPVPVFFKGGITTADKALEDTGIQPFIPDSKEGLALTNGTAFMASMLAIGYLRELHELENILAMQGLFLNAAQAINTAFMSSIHNVRGQHGQTQIAKFLRNFFVDSPFINNHGIQDDYSIRCLPQIFGPKFELILSFFPMIERELNAVTDNPLIFKDQEISEEVAEEKIFHFKNSKWAVLSGGNFHGEYLATIADAITTANVKLALTMERQITFLMNPARNKGILPVYLIKNEEKKGLLSGFMITQYTANAVVHKISMIGGSPSSIHNITSANEAEDVVSYGANAGEKFLEQLDLIHQFNSIYLTVVTQAYSIIREKRDIPSSLLTERLFSIILKSCSSIEFPIKDDHSFDNLYLSISNCSKNFEMRGIIKFPLLNELGLNELIPDKNSIINPLKIDEIF